MEDDAGQDQPKSTTFHGSNWTVNKIKVLHLVEDLKPGGLENIIADIACGLNREAFDVEVWAVVKGGEVAEELLKAGIIQELKVHNNS